MNSTATQAQEGGPKDHLGVSGQRLRAFLDRIHKLTEEKAAMAEDIKEIYMEAKSNGFDTKIIKKIVKLEKMDKERRQEEEELLELYKSALGL